MVQSADQVHFALKPLSREKAGISSLRTRAVSGSTSPAFTMSGKLRNGLPIATASGRGSIREVMRIHGSCAAHSCGKGSYRSSPQHGREQSRRTSRILEGLNAFCGLVEPGRGLVRLPLHSRRPLRSITAVSALAEFRACHRDTLWQSAHCSRRS